MSETNLKSVKVYADGSEIRAALGDNELYVEFAVVDEAGDVELQGSVKWDGCMNWETSPTCMYHFCRPDDADRLAAIFKDIWIEGRKLMPKADAHYGS